MMKKDLALERPALPALRFRPSEALARTKAVRSLARLYGLLLEETVSPAQALRLLHAQVAAVWAVCPVGMPVALRLLSFAWAWMAVRRCQKA